MSSSEMEDQHSIWNGRFKAKPQEGKLFLEILSKMSQQFFEDDSKEEILKFFWGETEESLQKIISKSNKREKKKKAIFEPENLKKPLNANHLFGRKFKEDCDKNNTKFSLKDSNEAWKKLSDKEKAKYIKQADADKIKYKAEYEKLRAKAINDGEFPEDKPKKPLSGYFLYLQEVRPNLNKKYKNEINRKTANLKITSEAAEMWNKLTEPEKDKYNNSYRIAKAEFDQKLSEWTSKETNRRKKLDGEPDEVNIESTGTSTKNKSKTEKVKSTKNESHEEAEPEEDATNDDEVKDDDVPEEDEEEPKEEPKAKTSTKKAVGKSKKIKVESENEETQINSDIEDTPKPSKVNKKSSKKNKVKVESDNDE